MFTKKIYDLARETGLTSGKWMIFVNRPVVDELWSRVAHALGDADGALAHSACTAAKVGASEYRSGAAYLICVYIRDSFNLREVEEVFHILTDEVGFLTAYFKADAMVGSLSIAIPTTAHYRLSRRSLVSTQVTPRSVAQRCTRTRVSQTFLCSIPDFAQLDSLVQC